MKIQRKKKVIDRNPTKLVMASFLGGQKISKTAKNAVKRSKPTPEIEDILLGYRH